MVVEEDLEDQVEVYHPLRVGKDQVEVFQALWVGRLVKVVVKFHEQSRKDSPNLQEPHVKTLTRAWYARVRSQRTVQAIKLYTRFCAKDAKMNM